VEADLAAVERLADGPPHLGADVLDGLVVGAATGLDLHEATGEALFLEPVVDARAHADHVNGEDAAAVMEEAGAHAGDGHRVVAVDDGDDLGAVAEPSIRHESSVPKRATSSPAASRWSATKPSRRAFSTSESGITWLDAVSGNCPSTFACHHGVPSSPERVLLDPERGDELALALAGTVSPVKLGVSNTLIGIVCHTDERHAS
jgi:hypothetical protein